MSDISLVQNDTSPSIFGTLAIDGTAVNLTGASVRFQMRQAGSFRYSVDASATIVTPAAGAVRYDLMDGDLTDAGEFLSRWEITFADLTVQHTTPENTITVGPQ